MSNQGGLFGNFCSDGLGTGSAGASNSNATKEIESASATSSMMLAIAAAAHDAAEWHPKTESSLAAEESSHAASVEIAGEDGFCVAWGDHCDPKTILPWKKCCAGPQTSGPLAHVCCDLGPGPVPSEGGFVCAFQSECPSRGNEVMV